MEDGVVFEEDAEGMRERMRHFDKWERQLGHRYVRDAGGSLLERNEGRRIELECRYEGCGKKLKSKGWLVKHQKRVYRAPLERVKFKCGRCGLVCETEMMCLNPESLCVRVGGIRKSVECFIGG